MEAKKLWKKRSMQTIDDCIRDEILKDILIQQKAEVVQMILETFDRRSMRSSER